MSESARPQSVRPRRGRLLADFGYILRRPWAVAKLMLGFSLSADFRERIMLAVTQVNRCRLCSYAHTRAALRAGVPKPEVKALLHADLGGVPDGQRPAVLFAQHWAETQGEVDPGALAALEQHYDEATRAEIMLSIRFINAMNGAMGKFEG